MSRSSDFEWNTQERFLGTTVGKKIKFLALTSCMDIDERLMMAQIESFLILLKYVEKTKEIKIEEFIEKVIKPTVENLGYANWKRDILTDLSLKTSLIPYPRESLKNIGEE
jgi:hypothetical protein